MSIPFQKRISKHKFFKELSRTSNYRVLQNDPKLEVVYAPQYGYVYYATRDEDNIIKHCYRCHILHLTKGTEYALTKEEFKKVTDRHPDHLPEDVHRAARVYFD